MWEREEYVERPNTQGSAPGSGHAVALAPSPNGVTGHQPYGHTPGQVAVLHEAPPVASRCDVPTALRDQIELAKFLAEADLLPKALVGKPANVLLIMHTALSLDLSLATAIAHMYVIDGKLEFSAELLRIQLARHGHMLRWTTVDDKEVVGELILRHDPRHPRPVRFTLAQATRMQLTGQKNWKEDPESMMIARATTRAVSRNCPEISMGAGNLSTQDITDEGMIEAVRAAAEADQSDEHAATELLIQAQGAQTPTELLAIGNQAREADLLNVPVGEGQTLHQVLLQRHHELKQAAADDSGEGTS